jgi:hypothetical protein
MRWSRRVAVATLTVLLAGAAACGGDDSADDTSATGTTTTTIAGGGGGATTEAALTTTTAPGSSAGGGSAPGDLPDACTLLDDASVAAAIGASASGAAPQPANETSTSCDWAKGQPHSLALQVRAGTNAASSFANAIGAGFSEVDLEPAEGWIRLGARESARDYRLVSFAAYDGTYYVYFTLQGPDRDDAASTDVAISLAEVVYASLM